MSHGNITQKDIFSAVTDLRKEVNQTTSEKFREHGVRLANLENALAYTKGAIGILGLFSAGLTAWIWQLLIGQ